MLYRIKRATAHPDCSVTITWSDNVTATVDLNPVVEKGRVFAPMRDASFFVSGMTVAEDRMGLEWQGEIDFSAV